MRPDHRQRRAWARRPPGTLIFPALELAGTAWPPVTTPRGGAGFAVTVTAPPTRGAASYTFAFRRPTSVSGGTLDVEAGGMSAAGSSLSEANPWNNGPTATIRTVN